MGRVGFGGFEILCPEPNSTYQALKTDPTRRVRSILAGWRVGCTPLFIIPHSWKIILKNSPNEKIFCALLFESKREKRQIISQSTNLVCFFSVLKIILSWETDVREFQSIIDWVRNEICFKEIMSNKRLDLYYSSSRIWFMSF